MEGTGPKVISTLTVNYKPAIDASRQLQGITAQLDHQLRTLRMTATSVGQGVGAGFHQPMQQGQVILDRHGKVLVDVGKKTETLTDSHKQYDTQLKKHTTNVKQASQAYSVLGSQWERRISWFVAGVGFYGFIRAMRQAVDTMRQVEMDMVVIARTTNDVTFNLKGMRDELQNLGMMYGHTWETVSDVALRWTQAGYDMQDTLEQTRVGLLALNVAEMDVQMASQGLIAIMAQWGFEANQLEGVIDKLNITSDNFAVTTGDLVDALIRSSGAARAVHMTFEETLGIITATRVATGRTGREVGNAVNTMLSFIMRQMTLNKLMESGVNVFADAANTKLRPAMDILTEVADKWGDSAEEMPEQIMEIAEQMGLLSEEMAEAADMQQEWTDLQKIDIETSAAGVRRRSFFIALLRNFAQVQEVVNNMHDAEGYSMRQNIMTMDTLEKRQKQLQVSIEKLAIAMGEAGLLEQIKGVLDGAISMVEWFNKLDSGTRTLIITFAQLMLGLKILETLLKMSGLYTSKVAVASMLAATAQSAHAAASAKAAAASGAAATAAAAHAAALKVEAAAATAAAAAIKLKFAVATLGISLAAAGVVTYVMQTRRAREELEEYTETLSAVAGEQRRLDGILERSVKGSTEHNLALEQKRDMIDSIVDRYPELIAGYDTENEMYVLNAEKLKEVTAEMERQKEAMEDIVELSRETYKTMFEEARQYENSADRLERLYNQRQRLIESLEDEGQTAEEYAIKKEKITNIDEAIIRITGELDKAIKTSADITRESIDRMIEAFRDKGREAEASARRVIAASEAEAKVRVAALTADRAWRAIQLEELKGQRATMTSGASLFPPGVTGRGGAPVIALQHLDQQIVETSGKINAYSEEIVILREFMKELNETMIDAADEAGSFSKATEEAGGPVRSMTDIINAYINAAMRASYLQGLINDETQRSIDMSQNRIAFLSRENATAWERAEALREEARLLPLLREKQQGIHEQANLLREVLPKLIGRQASLNLSTDEGRDAYDRLQSSIESIRDELVKLGAEWFNLETAQNIGISGLERIRSLRATEIQQIEDKIRYLTRETSTTEELAQADQLRIRLSGLYAEKMLELNNKIREQEEYQRELNALKEQGRIALQTYNRELAESAALVAELTGELFDYKAMMQEIDAVNYTAERSINRMEEAYKQSISTLDYFSRLGIYTVEQHLQKTQELYTRYGQLTVEQEMDKYRRLAGIYKDMLSEMKRYAEDAYRDRIKMLEKETEESIRLIQQQVDALDEEKSLEDREEARRQHEQKVEDLLEKRRYHELRTGIEHEKAIIDIDRQLSEGQRSWDSRQAEWERQDRRDDYNRQIEDIRDAAKAQQEEWQDAYDRMQAGFNDHNLSLIALAAAYDPQFWDDAKRKGELWAEGFKTGLPSDMVGNYLDSLLGPAEDRIGMLHDDIYSAFPHYPITDAPSHYEPQPDVTSPTPQADVTSPTPRAAPSETSFPSEYVIDHPWGHTYKLLHSGHSIYKDGRYVPAENFEYLPEDILQLARDMKVGKAHTGAETLTYGIAELKPGELIFPPNLSLQLKRLIEVLTVQPLQPDGVGNGRINNFYAPLFNVEEQNIGDEVDAEITFRELKRQVDSI